MVFQVVARGSAAGFCIILVGCCYKIACSCQAVAMVSQTVATWNICSSIQTLIFTGLFVFKRSSIHRILYVQSVKLQFVKGLDDTILFFSTYELFR